MSNVIYERWENGVQVDTAKTLTHCKYCERPYYGDATGKACQCGVTPLSLFHYHHIIERLDNIETLLKEKK